MKTKESLKKVLEVIEAKKGEGLVVLDVTEISSFTDFFVICHGNNPRQCRAISEGIRERLKADAQLSPSHVEGATDGEWILMDYLDFIVHIFSEQAREFYKLERLWSDGKQIQAKSLAS